MKRLAARASLQRPFDEQILEPFGFFKFCKNEITGITSIYLSKSDVDVVREKMKKRYENARTIPGTRSYHHFQPISTTKIGAKRLSEESKYSIEFDFTSTSRAISVEIS